MTKKTSKQKKHEKEKKLLEGLEKHPAKYLRTAPSNYLVDEKIITKAIEKNPICLAWAHHTFRSEKTFILKAVAQDGSTFKFADQVLRRDKDFVLQVMKTNGYALEYALNNLSSDLEVVHAAIESKPRSLQYASKSLRDNDEIVKHAIELDGYSLKYASKRIKSDPKYLLLALKTDQRAFKFIKFDYDDSFVRQLLNKGNRKILKYCYDYKYQSNQELQWLALGNYKTIRNVRQLCDVKFKCQ